MWNIRGKALMLLEDYLKEHRYSQKVVTQVVKVEAEIY